MLDALSPQILSNDIVTIPSTSADLNEDVCQFHYCTIGELATNRHMQDYFRMRKDVFVDQLGWELFIDEDGFEKDEYDTEDAIYVMRSINGETVAGLRLLPTTNRFTDANGIEKSYLLRDSFLGKIENIDKGVCEEEPPTHEQIWEMTRVITSAQPKELKLMMEEVCAFHRAQGGSHYLFHTRKAVARLAVIWGYDMQPLGPLSTFGKGQYQAYKVSVYPSK